VRDLSAQSFNDASLAVPATVDLAEFPPLNPILRESQMKLVHPTDFLTEVVVTEVQTRAVGESEGFNRDSPKCGSSSVMVGLTVCRISMDAVQANQLVGETQEQKNSARKKVAGPLDTGLGPWSQISAWEEYPHIPLG
jgi:hypothetical protein